MGLLDRGAILQAVDEEYREVDVPEWGGIVRLRSLTAAERDNWEEGQYVGKGRKRKASQKKMRAALLMRSIVDEDGKRIFTEADIPLLGKKSAKAVERLVDEILAMNGMTQEEYEEALGNSASGPSEDSGSA